MSRGVGRAIGLVAAIAMPFFAPAIAGAVGLSTAVTGAATFLGAGKFAGAIGATIGSGLVGAGMGAANAALTGGNVGLGALGGGLAGGFLGATGGGFKFGQAAITGPKGAFPTIAQANAATPAVPGAGVVGAGGLPGAVPGVVGAGSMSNTVGAIGPTGLGATGAGTAGQGAARTMLGRISQSLGNATPDIMQKAAVFIASNVLAGTSAKENALISQAAARMREIEGQNKGLYDMMLAEAQAINPQARGMQYYNDAQLQGIAAGEAAVEGMSPRDVNAKSEISRRYLQRASANATLAYRQGYDSGETQRRSALGNLGNMPQSNAAMGALALEQTRRANQAANAAGIRSSLGTIFTPDPGTATEDELLGNTDNDAAMVGAGAGGG